MILHTQGNGSHPDENNIFLGWQKKSISKAGLESSVQPQRVASLDP